MPKKEKINRKVVWGAFIAIIMVSSVFGVIFGSFAPSENKVDYGEFSFERRGDYWVTKVNKKNVQFYFFPSEVEYVNLSREVADRLLNTKMLYVTYNPNQTIVEGVALVQFDLQKTLYDNFGIYVANALTIKESDVIPVITCENATSFVPVVEFRESNTTSIDLENNCIVVEAEETRDVFLIRDRLVYGLLGIIK